MALFVCQDFCPEGMPVGRVYANTTPIQFVIGFLARESTRFVFTLKSTIKTGNVEG
jgi:hypothetical protein